MLFMQFSMYSKDISSDVHVTEHLAWQLSEMLFIRLNMCCRDIIGNAVDVVEHILQGNYQKCCSCK